MDKDDPANSDKKLSTSQLKQAVPQGLEALVNLESLLVKQELELVEVLCSVEGRNHYSVKDEKGREIMKADETTCCCFLRFCCNCCITSRPFNFTIDTFEGVQIFLDRKVACNSTWCPCCLNKVIVTTSNGETLGYVKQRWSCTNTYFYIKDADKTNVLKIKGPACCACRCCCDVKFLIESMDGTDVGYVSKKWGGILKEAMTDVDSFGITFPKDLDCRIKAVLIGAAILIDFMFFEDQNA